MKRGRSVLFVLFVVCLVAAMPFAWGAGGFAKSNLAKQNRLSGGVSDDVSTKVTLCRIPPGNPANAQTIVVSQAAVAAHLAHGDSLGACPQACGVPSAVPKTGQTTCWDINGYAIDCAGTGQDGDYQKGVSVDQRFTDNGDGTVTDNLTGLIWLKNADCFGYQTWNEAVTVSNTLASGACGLTDGSVAGDWRLPNRKELESLLDLGQFDPALPLGHPFSGVRLSFYWSSTAYAYPNFAWDVNMVDGYVIFDDKNGILFVWPVRGGQ